MIRVLFICHGNICRSPMAEYVLKSLVAARGASDLFEISSAATSTEEIGNPVYPPARRELVSHGISCDNHHARQMSDSDYDYYDYIIAMDRYNLRNMVRFIGDDPQGKVSLLMDWTDNPHDVADPWYTGDFRLTWNDILQGCNAFLDKIL